MNILMVCLGNICRSPLAEGILKHKLQTKSIDARVDSAGTSDYHVGEPADPRTLEVARKHNIDISSHRARQFDVSDFDRYDRIYAMDRQNYDTISNLTRNPQDADKVELYLNILKPGTNSEVPDPYWSGRDGFENVFRLLDEAGEKLSESLKKQSS